MECKTLKLEIGVPKRQKKIFCQIAGLVKVKAKFYSRSLEVEVGRRRSECESLTQCASDSHKVMVCLHQLPS